MTVIYVPRLIESAEQAEALEPGTIATLAGAYPCCKNARQEWTTSGSTGWWGNADMIGWTALMPVEAEEEWAAEFDSGEMYMNLDQDSARDADGGTAMSRLVTPWEEA